MSDTMTLLALYVLFGIIFTAWVYYVAPSVEDEGDDDG
jgi:hypothetical protein